MEIFIFVVLQVCLGWSFATNARMTLSELNVTKYSQSSLLTQHLPGILSTQNQIMEKRALDKLIGGLERYIIENEPITGWVHPYPFQDLIPAIYLHPQAIHASDGAGDNEKYFIGVDAIKRAGKDYVVYAAGVAGQPKFENYMAGLGATVVAFDCTDQKRRNYNFDFYPWCIGKAQSFQGSRYAHGQDTGQQFYTLKEIQQKLSHKRIHMLKMDIEGFEWDLLQHEIIEGEESALPEQLLFELHTEGANSKFVPPNIVHMKRINEVNQLVFDLWTRGYRLANVELNAGDSKCAEMAFVRIPPHKEHNYDHGSPIGKAHDKREALN